MKTFSYKSLVWLVDLSFWIYAVIGIIVITIYLGVKLWDGDQTVDFVVNTSITKKLHVDPAEATVKSIASNVFDPTLEASKVLIRFKTNDLFIRAMFAATTLFIFAYILSFLYLLRKFVRSLKSGSPFEQSNVNRLQRMGVLLLMVEPLTWLASLIFHSVLDNKFQYTDQATNFFFRVGYKIGYNLGTAGFISTWIVTGLIVLVIAEVFRLGLKMKEEQDLTV